MEMSDYDIGSDYEPLQVELEVRPPIYLTSPYICFDGIISYLCMRDCLGEAFYTLPSEKILPTEKLVLPLMKTDDVYHASVSIFKDPILKKDTIYKRFTDKETYHLTERQQQGKIKINQGHFKDFMINLPILLTDKVLFYCNGDKKALEYLLGNLRGLGKKTSIGSGRIMKVEITPTPEDYSFYKDGEIMRPIPTKMRIPMVEGMRFQMEAYKPPYWDKRNVAMCYVPTSKIKV